MWVLMSPWRMDVKWYMKCFIYWTADLKSSKPWSSQLWTQFKQLRIEAWKSQDFNGLIRYRWDALTNWAMKPLTLGGDHLWVLISTWRMDVPWYMTCFIYWTADLKSSKPWSSQLWSQFKQLRIEAWKSQDFNGQIKTGDLAIPVRRSNQLSYEATDVGRWSFVSSNEGSFSKRSHFSNISWFFDRFFCTEQL